MSKISRRGVGVILQAGLGFVALGLACQPAHASTDSNGDRSSVGGDITIQKGDTARNVACMACSVYVHGNVDGNIAVVMGNVVVDGTVDGKVAVVMGDLQVLQGGTVQGDTAIALGKTDVQGGSIEGRHASVSSGPIFAAMAVPFLILALLIWLIVWVIRRSRAPRYPYPPPPPPPGIR